MISVAENKKPPAGIDQPDGGFIVSAEITILFNCLDELTPILIGVTLFWLQTTHGYDY